MRYRPEIDGLRAIAVIPVILFHLGYDYVKGGYYGVDVFFVISGYLITSIIIKDIQSNTFSVYNFWIKRVKRLLPLLLTITATALVGSTLLLYKPDIQHVAADTLPALFSYYNFHALLDFGSYWGRASEESLFLHTWSLSVEEQFYLLYPGFLYLCHKYLKNFLYPILAITLLSATLFIGGLFTIPNVVFFMLPFRAWELGLGGLAVFVQSGVRESSSKRVIPFIGIMLIVSSYIISNVKLDLFAFLPVLGSFLIISFSSQQDLIGKLLSNKILVFIGKISYSLYLWHWLVIVFRNNIAYTLPASTPHVSNAVVLITTVLLSILSHKFIESKTRYNPHTPKIVLICALGVSSLALYLQSDFFNARYESKYNKSSFYGVYYDITPSQNLLLEFMEDNDLFYGVSSPRRPSRFSNAFEQDGITSDDYGTKSGHLLLLGDSHGGMWAKVVEDIASDLNVATMSFTSTGTKPFFDLNDIEAQSAINGFSREQRISYAKAVIQAIEDENLRLVIIACRWQTMTALDWSRFQDMLSLLEGRGIDVMIMNQPPVLDFMVNKNANQYFSYLGFDPIQGFNRTAILDTSAVVHTNRDLSDLVGAYANVSVFNAYNEYMDNGKARITHFDDLLYFDDDHLSYEGTLLAKNMLADQINSLLATED